MFFFYADGERKIDVELSGVGLNGAGTDLNVLQVCVNGAPCAVDKVSCGAYQT